LSLSSSKTMSGGQNELFIGNTNDSGVWIGSEQYRDALKFIAIAL
jgi:hypothetical protein